MSDAAPATPQKKGKTAKRKKTPSTHPKYLEMAISAIGALQERHGSSRQAIHKYIVGKYNVGKDMKVVNTHLKMALKRGVSTGVLKHVKGQGASGSFRLSAEKKSATGKNKTTPSKSKVVKPKSKAAAKPKAAKVVKKVSAKKQTKEKPKPKATKAAVKKPKAAKPKKKAAPAKPKSPKKPVAKKASKPKKAKSAKRSKK